MRWSSIRDVAVAWKHPVHGPESVIAHLVCVDATRRVCTWSAKVPPALSRQIVVTATDRAGRQDPTPDKL